MKVHSFIAGTIVAMTATAIDTAAITTIIILGDHL
jgi:hypothetical protein